MKIKKVKIKKMWHGFVSLRSYIYDEAKKNREGIMFIIPDGRTMTLGPSDLEKHFKNGYRIKSKQKEGQVYDLYDYDFREDKSSQLKLI